MARERYLVGVNEEELKPTPKAEPPKGPKGKLANYWYHYKWHTIGGIFAAVVMTVLIVQMATRTKYDYTIILATQEYVLPESTDHLIEEFKKSAIDVNGDGEINISLEALCLNSSDITASQAGSTKLMASVASGDVVFFIFDDHVYQSFIQANAEEGKTVDFFEAPGLDSDSIDAVHNYWNWKNSALRKDEAFRYMPEDLYFGVRAAIGTAKNSGQDNKTCMELLRKFIADTEGNAKDEK